VALRPHAYHFITEGTQQDQDFVGEPWFIDGPARNRTFPTSEDRHRIQVEDPIVLPIDDPRLFQYPGSTSWNRAR